MASLIGPEYTSFTLDNMGRYLCNTLQEALDSAEVTIAGKKRGFDTIVVGGGTFGPVLAQRLLAMDSTRHRRILVLEQGPFVLPEHQQNLPFLGGTPAFHVPWEAHPGLRFTGLIHAVGGRSMAWGGWSPELLHDSLNDEMADWPGTAVSDLKGQEFAEAGEQIGVDVTNDFIFGPLHNAMRDQLQAGLDAISSEPEFAAIPLDDLPESPIIRALECRLGHPPTDAELREALDLDAADPRPRRDLLNLFKIEAPLAVQSRTEAGLFPTNKFSSLPLIIKAAREESQAANGVGPVADARKRVVIVGSCHAQELITETQADNWVRVTGVRVVDRDGSVKVVPLDPPSGSGQGVVVLAAGTIETTRVAMTTFQQSLAWRAFQRMGRNLMAHLRSNLTIRVPREAIASLSAAFQSLQTSALFVKGKAAVRGVDHYFHIQITASGLPGLGAGSEAELFKKIPDAERIETMRQASDTHVVITLRGIGEMSSHNPDSRVDFAGPPLDFDRPRAQVSLGNAHAPSGSQQTRDDHDFWGAMDAFTDHLAVVFANGHPFEILDAPNGRVISVPAGTTAVGLRGLFPHPARRDALGTTHHEAGTLWMGDDVAQSVTNDFGRIHDTTNCYVVGPPLFPTIGSPNPMLTGVALANRTARLLTDQVLPRQAPFSADTANGFVALFDGTQGSYQRWKTVGGNDFALVDGQIVTYGSGDIGLLYFAAEAFGDFVLRVQFRIFDQQSHNSGIFVRFRNPLVPLPEPVQSRAASEEGTDRLNSNLAVGPIHSGFEVQIDDFARGDSRKDFYGARPEPDGLRKNRTGAIYKIPARDFIPNLGRFDDELQVYQPGPALFVGPWFEFEIEAAGDDYRVRLENLSSGEATQTSSFRNTDPPRGVGEEGGEPVGYIGLQSYPNSPLAFRNIQIRRL